MSNDATTRRSAAHPQAAAVIDALRTTCAVRRFTDEPISDADIETCLRAAIQGPSGGNIQPWQFVVVRDIEARRALGDLYRRSYERYEPAMLAVRPPARTSIDAARERTMLESARHLAEHLGDAPALVVVLVPRMSMTLTDAEGPLDVGSPLASVYPAVQNLMLAARALGIGSTLTTVIRVRQAEALATIGAPERYEIAALIPLGRPAGRFFAAARRPVESVTHWDRFGNKRSIKT